MEEWCQAVEDILGQDSALGESLRRGREVGAPARYVGVVHLEEW